jgi:radical SAM protein with 4Fe4S-binding SPASM domain
MITLKDRSMDITSAIKCPIGCKKYCPYEVFQKNYKGIEFLTLENLGKALDNVPLDVKLSFGGFCEPFVHPDEIDLIFLAVDRGYSVSIFSTLHNVTLDMVDMLNTHEFESFCVHLPDPYNTNKVRTSPEYWQVFEALLRNQPSLFTCIMNDTFTTMGRENMLRGKPKSKFGPVLCDRLAIGQYTMLPNGDLTMCCNDFGLKHIFGNIYKEDYDSIARGRIKKRTILQNLSFNDTYCKSCTDSYGVVGRMAVKRLVKKITGW